jgi:putative DNA methylase
MTKRRLIEDWLPIAALSAEGAREGSAAIKPPLNRHHVWWARRPLVASRAAILASLADSDSDRTQFLYALGIHGDPVETKLRIAQAKITGEDLGTDPYGYPRAFQYLPERKIVGSVLDPTAGGGSIPFEAVRLGCKTVCNDLNPVAALLLNATIRLPSIHRPALFNRYEELSAELQRRAAPRLSGIFPSENSKVVSVDGYLWARTVTCPYCGRVVPLSPNWKLSGSGHGVRLVQMMAGCVSRLSNAMPITPQVL